MMKKMFLLLQLLLCSLLLISGCSKTETQETGTNTEDVELLTASTYTITYVCDSYQDPWSIHIGEGIKAMCDTLGIKYVQINCAGRDDLYLRAFNQMSAQTSITHAVITTPTSEGLETVVTSTLSELNIPVICLNARLRNTEGKDTSFVGIEAYKEGQELGEVLAAKANEEGFLSDSKSVKVILMTISNMYFEKQLINGINDTLSKELPSLGYDHYIQIETFDKTFEMQYGALKQSIVLDQETHYICCFFNDDGAYAFYRLAEEQGYDTENAVICAAGGYEPSYEIFSKMDLGADNYYVLGINPIEEGETAVQLLYSLMQTGEPLPDITLQPTEMITVENFESYFESVYDATFFQNDIINEYYQWSISKE